MPLVTYGAMTAAIIAVSPSRSGAIILIPTFLWSLGLVNTSTRRSTGWSGGPSATRRSRSTSPPWSIWYPVAALTIGAKPLNEKISRGAFVLYILFLQLASAHHLLVDPGGHPRVEGGEHQLLHVPGGAGIMIHGFTVPGAMELAQRRKGFTNGVFEWLRKAPWGNPGFSAVHLAGHLRLRGRHHRRDLGTEQINIIVHNTLYVPGHFHATVVGGTTLAFMALILADPALFKREMVLPKAKLQPYLFGIGALVSPW